MKKVISSSFSVSAQKSAVSVDHIDNYYLLEASGTPPSVNDTRWRIHRTGETIPVPTSAAPFLWHKSVTYLSDGTHLEPVIEFGGSLGQNGIDYDLVPSHSSILKAEDGTLTPSEVYCNLVKRNADGSAEKLSSVPAGYSVLVYADASSSNYTIGTTVGTDGVSVISFVLCYGNIEIERHDVRVISEGGQGMDGRGIQSQDYRFKANTDGSVPSTPTNDSEWNTWSALSNSGYSSVNKYLFRCLRTVYVNGNGTTETTYLVDGPTVWGTDGKDIFVLDLDNEMDSVPCDSTGKVTSATTITTHARLYRGDTVINSGITAPDANTIKIDNTTPSVQMSQGIVTVSWIIQKDATLSSDHLTVSIPVTYNDKQYVAVFTLNVVKSGSPGVSPVIYSVIPSVNACPFTRDANDALTPASYSVACGYSKTIGSSVTTETNKAGIIDSNYRIFYRYLNSNGDWSTWIIYSLAIKILSDTTYTAYEFCIASVTSAADVTDSKILDREVVPITKSGARGNEGIPGADGNGIASVTVHRKYTPTLTPPMANESGWIASTDANYPLIPLFSDTSHYLWEKRTTTYTKSSSVDVQIVLVAASDTKEIRPQLLTGTSFDSEETMTDWVRLNGAVVPEALRGQNAWGFLPNAAAKQYDLLRQTVYKPGDICKIQPNQWYTLSFYARDRKMVNEQSNKYGFAAHSVYLMPGTYRLEFNGRCTEAARSATMPVALYGYLFNNSWSNLVDKSIITTEDITVKSSVLTVSTAELYTIRFYAYKDAGTPGGIGEEVRVNWFRVICESRKDSSGTAITGAKNALATYLYPSALDNSGVRYMDGQVVTTLPGDGCVYWNLANDTPDSDGWTRHWVSFKTKSQITAAEQNILFRAFGSYVEIAAVKLERGVMPTAWCEHNYDSHTECSHNPCGKWRAGTTYYYCNGQRDVVRAKASASGGDTWWRMKRRTAHTGYLSNTEPYLDTEHWERGNNLKFSIVDAMFAEEIITDKLTVAKFLSTGENSHIAMQNGVAEFYGVFAFPNIRVGVDSSGCSILEFYGPDGQKMYDLGPNGLSKIDTSAASFTEIRLMLVKEELTESDAATVYNLIRKITKNDTTAYYKFSPKRTTTGSTTVYWYGGTSHSTAPAETGKYYQSKLLGYSGSTQDLPTGALIPNGWYAKQNDGIFHSMPSVAEPEIGSFIHSRYISNLYYFSSGKQTKTGYVQWETDAGGIVLNITLMLN